MRRAPSLVPLLRLLPAKFSPARRWHAPRPDSPKLPSSNPDDAAVVDDVLKLGGGSTALSGCQECLAAHVRRIEAGDIDHELNLPQLDG
jgi:hypothetical protein